MVNTRFRELIVSINGYRNTNGHWPSPTQKRRDERELTSIRRHWFSEDSEPVARAAAANIALVDLD
jgi:hypothetical protein